MPAYLWTTIAIALIFVPFELLLPARRPPRFSMRRYGTDILHAVVGGFLIRAGYGLLMLAILDRTGRFGVALDQPLWLQLVEIILICDFGFWIAHRLFHAVPWLWRFHAVHHSSEHLDWLAAYRVHPVDQIVNSTIIMLPAMLLGFSPVALLIYGVLYQWHAILLHSNVRVSFGALGRIVASPQYHHWHHANEPEAYDRNFGGQLVIWDRIFRTANFQDDPRPGRYGLDTPLAESFVAHLLSPFVSEVRNGKSDPVR